MAFTTQALASVAYQVGNLAGNTVRMLDLQAAALRQVEARVSTLGQVRSGRLPASPPGLQPHEGTFPSDISLLPFPTSKGLTLPQKLGNARAIGTSYLCACICAGPCCPTRQELPEGKALSFSDSYPVW